MKKNMGSVDRSVRTIVAVLIASFYYNTTISGVIDTVLLVVAGIFLLASIIGFCPLYALFGISSCPSPGKN